MNTDGFSLVELMVTVSIIAIVGLIAYPNYMAYVTKTRRTDAMGVLLQDASYMERFYTENGCYRVKGTNSAYTNPPLPYARSPVDGSTAYYAISLDAASSGTCSTFVLTADPTGTVQAADGILTLGNSGAHGWPNNPKGSSYGWQQ